MKNSTTFSVFISLLLILCSVQAGSLCTAAQPQDKDEPGRNAEDYITPTFEGAVDFEMQRSTLFETDDLLEPMNIAVMDDNVFIFDRVLEKLIVYSHSGERLRDYDLPGFGALYDLETGHGRVCLVEKNYLAIIDENGDLQIYNNIYDLFTVSIQSDSYYFLSYDIRTKNLGFVAFGNEMNLVEAHAIESPLEVPRDTMVADAIVTRMDIHGLDGDTILVTDTYGKEFYLYRLSSDGLELAETKLWTKEAGFNARHDHNIEQAMYLKRELPVSKRGNVGIRLLSTVQSVNYSNSVVCGVAPLEEDLIAFFGSATEERLSVARLEPAMEGRWFYDYDLAVNPDTGEITIYALPARTPDAKSESTEIVLFTKSLQQ